MSTDPHINYINEYISKTSGKPTLKQFIADELEYIVKNTSPEEDYRAKWGNRFVSACASMKRAYERSRPDWGPVAEKLLEAMQSEAVANVTSSRSAISSENTSTTATPLNAGSRKLTADDHKAVKAMYLSLDKPKMWKLSTGKLVEEKMRLVAEKSTHEHPSHSLIMDPSDSVYQEYFTEAELEEIQKLNAPEIMPLPENIQEFIKNFQGATTIKELDDLAWSFKFDAHQEPDLRWTHVSVINALDLLNYGYVNKERTETDLLKRVWSFIDRCFDSSDILATSEKTSNSCSESLNKGRTDGSTRKKIGTKVDLLFSTQLFELGAMEAGRESDRTSTKSVSELHLKCPKTLKSIVIELARISPSQLRQIKSYGFVIAGMYLQSVVVDCPGGYVCRFSTLPDWLDYPICVQTFSSNFFQLVHLVWNTKQQMQKMQKLVNENHTPVILSYTTKRTDHIPPCFVPAPAESKARKRPRTDDADEA